MSLRGQIFLSVVIALAVALFVEGALACWQARRSVDNEMQTALEAGDRLVDNALLSLPEAKIDIYLDRLIRSFDGNRHIKVTLTEGGKVLATSHLAPPEPVPHWFLNLLEIPPQTRVDRASGLGPRTLSVSTDPHNEISETWEQFRDGVMVLFFLDLLVLALLYGVLRRTARPLGSLKTSFEALGRGDYQARIQPAGPEELSSLARAFNVMAERLGQLQAANLRLSDQMAEIQEEERADLARDLHDEMAPFLFAVRLDAQNIELGAKDNAEIAGRAHAIGEAVTHMQIQVDAILRQLRPEGFPQADLASAIANLVAFWNKYDPGVDIAFDFPDAGSDFTEDVEMTIFRVVQEGITNAVRHGRATRVRAGIQADGKSILVTVDDNGRGIAAQRREGQGLKGMRERLAPLGGDLLLHRLKDGTQLKVVIPLSGGCLPAEAAT